METYKARGLKKLGLRSRTDLVLYAVRAGWLTPAGPPADPRAAGRPAKPGKRRRPGE